VVTMAFVPVVYSSGAPVLASGGTSRVACVHLAQWLEVYDALQVARGRGHVVYYQTVGGADASAGTHLCGSAWDMAYVSDAAIMDAREMGAADWHRIPGYNGWPSSGANHVHGLILCGDNACNGYQYTAWLSGHNGLGLNGVGAGDTLPRPAKIRTWQQGIAWAQAQMGASPMTQTTTQEDDDMDVYAFTSKTGTGFRLRTALGETDLGNMGEVDACMSAINARVSRVMGPNGWELHYPAPCLDTEAALLASKLATIRKV